MAVEQPRPNFSRREDREFEGFFEARIPRENTRSRRFSASNLNSFREETRSFRHSTTISSTASSPGYTAADQIDPKTYSFTAALKALQARSGSGGCLSTIRSISDGNVSNSKWNEAEKYICNPLSGEIPLECLSAKTLSGRSMGASITESAPLMYSHVALVQTRPTTRLDEENPLSENEKEEEKRNHRLSTRDVGTQSTPPETSPSSTSPDSAPPVQETAATTYKLRGRILWFHDKQQLKKHEAGWKRKQDTRRKKEIKEIKRETSKNKDKSCSVWCLWLRRAE